MVFAVRDKWMEVLGQKAGWKIGGLNGFVREGHDSVVAEIRWDEQSAEQREGKGRVSMG